MSAYALGRKLSILNDCPLKLDFTEYDESNINHEGIELNLYRFNIKGEIASKNEFEHLLPKSSPHINSRVIRSVNIRFRRLIGSYTFHKKHYIRDIWKGNLKVLKAKPPCYLDGVWINPEYYNDIRHILNSELSLKEELRNSYFNNLLEKINLSQNSVGVHFRRNFALYRDANRVFGVLDLNYYYDSIDFLENKLGKLDIFVFSDDVDWVKKHFKPKQKVTIVDRSEHLTDAHDWELLKNCHHQICSNSTFAWWAAYLNPNENKEIVVPSRWYADPRFQEGYERGTFIPKGWKKV